MRRGSGGRRAFLYRSIDIFNTQAEVMETRAVFGDPIDGRFSMAITRDGGRRWSHLNLIPLRGNEGAAEDDIEDFLSHPERLLPGILAELDEPFLEQCALDAPKDDSAAAVAERAPRRPRGRSHTGA